MSNTFDVILTHEHTDFDALASLLGASLLFPDALPVLPRRLNRNVRDFLTLYKNHFRFITDRETPKGRVRRAILVDSRSVNWVKGMDRNVEFFIIDHHVDEDQPREENNVWSAAVGANTTLLLERLIVADYAPTPVEATLFALGIHEDTGSLTYPSTTHRDARCLAWLLEPQRNVNLEVLSHFLNHPLSEAQRALLDVLIDHSEFLEISGHTVVIAQADARDFREELSALATRLRDFHETDALFLVVNLGDIIQVVARSTTDEIDVGKVAAELGGGGHPRAAAAPIPARHNKTQIVRDRIVRLVEEICRSAVTVRHIMSAGRPQILSPRMSIHAAAELMQRYGHEGFPVVERRPDGREELLGVLTRRETDRALTHELGDQPVSRFMRAGQIFARPDDSVNKLRRLMIDSNWGQIPVVDENDHIIGIVTRTDLIKLWDESSLPEKHAGEIERLLRTTLQPVPHALLQLIGEEVDRLDFTVYVVGGFVRDLLLNRPHLGAQNLDMDIVIEGDAIRFAQRMKDLYGGRIVPHRRFNTAKWLLNNNDHPVHYDQLLARLPQPADSADLPAHLDFVSARTEFYTAPTVLPTVETSSIKLDLHRRDFTINSLGVCLNCDRWCELLDFYGGLNDLNRGVIRVLHSLSFVDDPTRILRAIRYEQRFDFTIEPRSLELLQDAVELVDRVSGARIKHELERIFQEETPEQALERLVALGVMERIHPSLVVDEWVRAKFALLRSRRLHAPPSSALAAEPVERLYWGLLVFRLSSDIHAVLTERLGLRAEVQRLSAGLALIRSRLNALKRTDLMPSEVVSILEKTDETALALARIACSEYPTVVAWLEEYERKWQHVRPELDGHDLAAMGIPKGPVYSRILDTLRAARLDGRVRTREQEMALAVELAHAELSKDVRK